MNNLRYKINDNNVAISKNNSIKELCAESPFLVINTPCGIGKYKFNRIGYSNSNEMVLEYVLIVDNQYKDSNIIKHNLGKFYYLSAEQVLYAFKYVANT